MELCLILIKPDSLQRGLVGEIISRFEHKGLKIVGIKMMSLEDKKLNEHYAHIQEEPFFDDIKEFMQSSPVVAMALSGRKGTVEAIRSLVGPTHSHQAPAGTIRGDFGMTSSNNIVHASDSVANGKLEVGRFFDNDELFDYNKTEESHVWGK